MVKKRPLKRTSIAANEARAKVQENRIASARPQFENQTPTKTATNAKSPTRKPKSETTGIEIWATVKIDQPTFDDMMKRLSQTTSDEAYVKKFLGKETLRAFRAIDWLKGKQDQVKQAVSYREDYGEDVVDAHRGRIVLSKQDRDAVHKVCGDPLIAIPTTRCVNAVLLVLARNIASQSM